MKHTRLFLCVCICLTASATLASAQQSWDDDTLIVPYRDYSVGIYGSYNFNQHSTGMQGLPTIPSCCPVYGTGTGNGFILGLLFDVLFTESIGAQARVGIHNGGGLLRALENETVNTDGVEQQGVFEHTITSKHFWLTVEPLFAYTVNEHLQFMLGPSFGVLLSSSFSQKETILQPSDALFNNDSTSRAIYSGKIPETKTFAFGITSGIRYEIPVMDRDLSIAPEVFYTYSLTSLQSSESWTMNAFRIGLSVQYNFWIYPLP